MATVQQYVVNFTDPSTASFIVSPYTTNGRDFPISTALAAGAVSAASSLLFYGKGSADYGERIQENLMHIMENFSGPTAPLLPTSGQLWFSRRDYWRGLADAFWKYDDVTSAWVSITITYTVSLPVVTVNGEYAYIAGILYRSVFDITHPMNLKWIAVDFTDSGVDPGVDDRVEKLLKIWNGEIWARTNGAAFVSDTPPSNPEEGDIWYDSNPSDDPWDDNQLKVWDGSAWVSSGGNYVRRTGDTMSGNLNFDDGIGVEGSGGGTILSAAGGTYFEATGPGVVSFSAGGKNIANVATPLVDADAVNKLYVDTAVGVFGTTLSSLTDVDITTTPPTVGEVLRFAGGSPASWFNYALTVTDITGAAPISGPAFIGIPTAPTAGANDNSLQLATTAYVDNAVVAGDGVVDSILWSDPATRLLTLTRTVGGDLTQNLDHNHPAIEIDHDFFSAPFRDAFNAGAGSPAITVTTGDQAFEALAEEIKNIKGPLYQEIKEVLQIVYRPTVDTTDFVIAPDGAFIAGMNRMQVFVNGVKQYIDERAYSGITVRTGLIGADTNASITSPTGLSGATSYSFTVAVDAQATGSPQTPQTVTVSGDDVATVGLLVNEINDQVTGVVAKFSERFNMIIVASNTVGNGSAIIIQDVDMFTAMGNASGANLPIIFDKRFPDDGGMVISNDNAYFEAEYVSGSPVGSPPFLLLTTDYDTIGSGFVFHDPVLAGAIVEILIS